MSVVATELGRLYDFLGLSDSKVAISGKFKQKGGRDSGGSILCDLKNHKCGWFKIVELEVQNRKRSEMYHVHVVGVIYAKC